MTYVQSYDIMSMRIMHMYVIHVVFMFFLDMYIS